MPGFVREHIRPLAGAVGLHVLLFALIAATAWRWSSSRPPVPMAIEGVAIDERSLPKELTGARPTPAAPIKPAPEPEPVEPVPAPPAPSPPDDTAERQREAEVQAERERAAEAAREQAALETRRAEEAERVRQQKAAEEAARKAAETQAQRRKAAETERRKTAEDAARRKETAEQQAREAELQRRLAAEEEEASSVAASGVVDQYRAELEQAIERSWIRPPSAQAGLECTLNVTQAPGGTVLDVRLGSCNGDAAVRESITNAVFRASPLPAPADPRAFERRLEIVFRPTE
jgi:colicin import membrane protein